MIFLINEQFGLIITCLLQYLQLSNLSAAFFHSLGRSNSLPPIKYSKTRALEKEREKRRKTVEHLVTCWTQAKGSRCSWTALCCTALGRLSFRTGHSVYLSISHSIVIHFSGGSIPLPFKPNKTSGIASTPWSVLRPLSIYHLKYSYTAHAKQ